MILVSNVESRDLTRFAGDTALADLPDELFDQDKSPVPALAPQWALDGKGAPFAVSQLCCILPCVTSSEARDVPASQSS